VIRVDDLDQLLETAEALVHCRTRLPEGGRAGAITVSGGEIGLIGDLSQNLSISFPPFQERGTMSFEGGYPLSRPFQTPWTGGERRSRGNLSSLFRGSGQGEGHRSHHRFSGFPSRHGGKAGDTVCRCCTGRCQDRCRRKACRSHEPRLRRPGPDDQGILDDGNVPFLQGHVKPGGHSSPRRYSRFLKRGRTVETPAGKSPKTLPEILESLKGKRRVLGDDKAKKILQAYGLMS